MLLITNYLKKTCRERIFLNEHQKKNALFEKRRYVAAVMELSFSQLVKRGSAVCPARYFFVRALYKCVGVAQQALGVGWLGKKKYGRYMLHIFET